MGSRKNLVRRHRKGFLEEVLQCDADLGTRLVFLTCTQDRVVSLHDVMNVGDPRWTGSPWCRAVSFRSLPPHLPNTGHPRG